MTQEIKRTIVEDGEYVNINLTLRKGQSWVLVDQMRIKQNEIFAESRCLEINIINGW